ncbi:Asp23/Gls24 family envelope stress response protein [Streptomyces sp. MBT27]|uniref:Asp23/Gls24 family envelope stress response protein n=1 Tax=Streptomyces sp. MBT27 TaxID=1488356 RepID=UPI0014237388|nr:Asp23/Gls24 family envelope stress response protein [Streptomyces sp. MBT27]
MTTRIHPPDTPPPHDPDDERLPCGRLLSQVWADWEEGTADPHRADCADCTGAVAELEQLETAVRRLRDDTEDASGYDPAPLTERVMDVVRLELRPGHPLPLGAPDEDMWLMESAAARVLRTAAERVPGVRSGSCRITPEPDRPGRVAISLHILAPTTAPSLPMLADEVRREVGAWADHRLGLEITGIDVHVVGFADEPDDSEKGIAP